MNVYSLHSIYIYILLKLFYGRRGNTDTTDLHYTTRNIVVEFLELLKYKNLYLSTP